MSHPSPPGSGRTRRPRGSLTVDGILDAAEQVAAAGFDALTVRAVAAALDASPMALYRYFGTKEELVDALLDRVLGRYVPPQPTGDWVDDLAEFARRHRTLLVDHRWAVSAYFAHPTPGINAVVIGEVALAVLDRGGVRGSDAVAAFSALLALNYGWCAFALSRPDAAEPAGQAPPIGDLLRALPADRFPLTVSVADDLAAYGSDAHYEQVLADYLGGLRASAT